MQLITHANPFQPAARTVEVLDGAHTLAELAPQNESRAHILLHNGEPVLREHWADTIAADDDLVQVVYLPGTGIELAILQAIATFVVKTAINVAISYAATLLINKFVSPGSPSSSSNPLEAQNDRSPTYSLTAQGNQARLGAPIPVHYGRLEFYPEYASQPYTEFPLGGDAADQIFYGFYVLGHGEYEVERITLAGLDIDGYEDAEYEVIAPGGTPTLPVGTAYNVDTGNIELETGGDWIESEPTNPENTSITQIAFDLSWPAGIYGYDDEGDNDPIYAEVYVYCEIRALDNNGDPIGSWFNPFGGLNEPLLRKTGQVKNAISETYYVPSHVLASNGITRAQMRLKKGANESNDFHPVVVNNTYWAGLRGFTGGTKTYPNLTTLAIRLRASEQLTGSGATKLAVTATRKLPKWTGSTWSDPVATKSMVWAFADALRNTHYGAGLAEKRLDLDGLKALDDAVEAGTIRLYSDENGDALNLGLQFNARFESQQSIWQVITAIARAGRCTPYAQGGVLRLAFDGPGLDGNDKAPVAMFSERNIVRDSFQLDYQIPDADTAEAVRVAYWDEDDWAPREIAVRYDGAPVDTDTVTATVELFGVTHRAIAAAEAWYLARSNKYRRRTVTWETEMEGFIPSPGDVVSVTHSMPSWGQSADCISYVAATRIMRLSEPPDWTQAPLYLVWRNRDGTLGSPVQIQPGADDYTVLLASDPFGEDIGLPADEEPMHVVIGRENAWSRYVLVVGITPITAERVRIEGVVDDARVRTAPPETPPIVPGPGTNPENPTCESPVVYSVFAALAPGTSKTISATWSAENCATRFDVYVSQTETGDKTLIRQVEARTLTFDVPWEGETWVHVRAYGSTVGPFTTDRADLGDIPGTPNYLEPPTWVSIEAGINFVRLRWTNIASPLLTHVNVWRASVDDIADAVLIGQVYNRGQVYLDTAFAQTNVPYYYWLSSCSDYACSGVAASQTATPLPDVDGIFDDLADRINNSQLSAELKADLDSMVGATSIIEGIQQDIDDAINTLQNAPRFDVENTYAVGDLVLYDAGSGDGIYRCKLAITNTPAPVPTNATYWEKIGDYARFTDAVVDALALIAEINNISVDSESASARKLALLDAEISNAETGLTSKASIGYVDDVIADEQEARATAISALEAQISGTQFKRQMLTADDVDGSDTGVSVSTYSTGQKIDGQDSIVIVGSNSTSAKCYIEIPENIALSFAERTIRVGVRARAGSATKFGIAYQTSDTGNSAVFEFTATSNWEWYEFQFQVPAPSAGGVDQVTIYPNRGSGTANTHISQVVVEDVEAIRGAIYDYDQAIANEEEGWAVTTRLSSLQSEVDGNSAAITTLAQTVADEDSALSSRIDQLTATVNTDNLIYPGADINLYEVGAGKAVDWGYREVVSVTGQDFIRAVKAISRDTYHVGRVPVTPGEYLISSAWLNTTGTTHTCGFKVGFSNASGGALGWTGPELAAGTGWTKIIGSVEVPEGAVEAFAFAQIDAFSSFGSMLFSEPLLMRGATFAALQTKGMVYADEGGASGAYTIKIEACDGADCGSVGFGLGVVKENGYWVSDVQFRANRFALIDDSADPGGDITADMIPFAYDQGQVYLKNAMVRDDLLVGGDFTFFGTLKGGSDAETYDSGSGLYSGGEGGSYRFRIGPTSGAHMVWTGTDLQIKDGGNIILSAGTGFNLSADINAGVNTWKGAQFDWSDSGGPWEVGAYLYQNTPDIYVAYTRRYSTTGNWYNNYCLDEPSPGKTLFLTGTQGGAYDYAGKEAALLYDFPATAGQRYEVSCYVGAHHCSAAVCAVFRNSSGGWLTDLFEFGAENTFGGGKDLSSFTRVGGFITAPADTYDILVYPRISGLEPSSSAPFATFVRPFFGVAHPDQQSFSPWTPPVSNIITPGNASTYIANAAINTAQIGTIDASQANITNINASNITTGSLSASYIQGGTITADKIVTGALTFNQVGPWQITNSNSGGFSGPGPTQLSLVMATAGKILMIATCSEEYSRNKGISKTRVFSRADNTELARIVLKAGAIPDSLFNETAQGTTIAVVSVSQAGTYTFKTTCASGGASGAWYLLGAYR